MKKTITVTGATGFLGKHVIECLRQHDMYHLIATGRNESKLKELNTEYVLCDLRKGNRSIYNLLGRPEYLIHLAWDGLPHYQKLYHVEENLPMNYKFLKRMVQQGLKHLTVAGTCFEYGLQNGCLSENTLANPNTCYGIAKDSLRRVLEVIRSQYPFRLTWARLFYMSGNNQRKGSLIPSLDRAIDAGEKSFNMSGGEQLRDYLPVEEIARRLVKITLNPNVEGVLNICSGKPVSIRTVVEKHLAKRNADIRLNFGHYSLPSHEPLAFWGDVQKQNQALASNIKS